MRLRAALIALLVAGAAVAIAVLMPNRESTGRDDTTNMEITGAALHNAPKAGEQVPVSVNRGADVPDGFRGEVHPLLSGKTNLAVTAHWSTIGKGRDKMHERLSPQIYSWFTNLKPAQAEHSYTERDFSAFLPQTVGEVGQTWAIEPDKVAAILKQFHPRPSMHVVAQGRRAGPDGAFGILRAASPDYLDIAFRAHAEFYLTPPDWPKNEIQIRAWYTPAYFEGRVLVNRRTGAVDYFRLALPTDKSLNVHLTTAFQDAGVRGDFHDIVRVDRMELVGGDAAALEKTEWTKALGSAESDRKLAQVFFKFREIKFVPLEQVAARAREQAKPIFAIVSWGSFEDQSC